MEFGVFDHLDRNNLPLQEFYEMRLKIAEAYDRAGFFGYHIAEHHSTPLGLTPSPSVFLACVAQRTKRLHFGPLVYTLPLYHPLRLAEEVSMLDQISGGRMMFGAGRGISPIEARYYGLDPATAQEEYVEALEIILKALTGKKLTHQGKYHRFEDVPVELEPLQKPHPPVWLGIHSPETADWAARSGFCVASLDSIEHTRMLTDRYRAAWRSASKDMAALPKLGLVRFIVVGDSDDSALALARRAYPHWYGNFNYLYRLHGRGPVLGERPKTFDALVEAGRGFAGTPEAVVDYLKREISGSGVNYFIGHLVFGDMTQAEALGSIDLYARKVMPALRDMTLPA